MSCLVVRWLVHELHSRAINHSVSFPLNPAIVCPTATMSLLCPLLDCLLACLSKVDSPTRTTSNSKEQFSSLDPQASLRACVRLHATQLAPSRKFSRITQTHTNWPCCAYIMNRVEFLCLQFTFSQSVSLFHSDFQFNSIQLLHESLSSLTTTHDLPFENSTTDTHSKPPPPPRICFVQSDRKLAN